MELCQTVIRKFLDAILANKLHADGNETAIELLDMIFHNNLLNNKEFIDYVGKAICRLYIRDSTVFVKYLKEYKQFLVEQGGTLILSDNFKIYMSQQMRGLHYIYLELTTYKLLRIPSHFQDNILFVLNFITVNLDIIKLSDHELQQINNIIRILTIKDSNDRLKKIYENKVLIIDCIEKYLYHIVKIPAEYSEIKQCQSEYHIKIPDMWAESDIELNKLIGFSPDVAYAIELFDDDNFSTCCMDCGAIMVEGGFPCEIGVSGTVNEFLDKLKLKVLDLEKVLPYMKITPNVVITSIDA